MIDQTELSRLFTARRHEQNISLGSAAEECGVSKSTLSRFEHGIGRLDSDTLLAITNWLGVRVPDVRPDIGSPISVYIDDTLGAICEQIRKDSNLTESKAEALCELMSVAYREFAEN
jgi:transcriptional regulator with XRE-family HTH domain